MKVYKIRRVGNSNVITLPPEFAEQGYAPDTSVLVQDLPNGEVRLIPTARVRELVRGYGRRVVAEDQKALQILAEHDRVQ